jgi:acyl-CoA thioesterase-2
VTDSPDDARDAHSGVDPAPGPLQDLLETLDLEELGSAKVSVQPTQTSGMIEVPETFAEDITLFRGKSQKMPHGRVFGGQVLAQGVMACGRTITESNGGTQRRLHSIHAYFMRPGDDTQPITFSVERMRDGRSFSTRRVHAIQHGAPILSMSASFQDPAGGMDHQDEMPQVPAPLEVPSLSDIYGDLDDPRARHIAWSRPVELRHVEGNLFVMPGHERVAHNNVWMRAIGELPDDPLIHDAVLAYASDYSLLDAVLRRHGRAWSHAGLRVASLDHAMWFHRPARADDWILYAQQSPSAQGGRGLAIGRMFTADGTLVATVAQEGMMRLKDLP